MNLLHFFLCVLIASTIALVVSFFIKKADFDQKLDSELKKCGVGPDVTLIIESLKVGFNKVYQQPFIAGIVVNIILILIFSICISINCSRGWFLFWVIVFGVLCDFLLGVIFILQLDTHKQGLNVSVDSISPPDSECNKGLKKVIDVLLNTYMGINVHNIVIGILSLVCLLIQTNKASKIPIPTPPLVS